MLDIHNILFKSFNDAKQVEDKYTMDVRHKHIQSDFLLNHRIRFSLFLVITIKRMALNWPMPILTKKKSPKTKLIERNNKRIAKHFIGYCYYLYFINAAFKAGIV